MYAQYRIQRDIQELLWNTFRRSYLDAYLRILENHLSSPFIFEGEREIIENYLFFHNLKQIQGQQLASFRLARARLIETCHWIPLIIRDCYRDLDLDGAKFITKAIVSSYIHYVLARIETCDFVAFNWPCEYYVDIFYLVMENFIPDLLYSINMRS